MGYQGAIGPTGLAHPTTYSFASVAATYAITGYLGNVTTHSISTAVSATLQNITNGKEVTGTLDASGQVTLTATEGWFNFYLNQTAGKYNNYTNEVDLTSTAQSATYYLISATNDVVDVKNGPVASDTVTILVHGGVPWGTQVAPSMNVILYNGTGSTVVATASLAQNDTAVFEQVNPAYGYTPVVDCYSMPSADLTYGMTNQSYGQVTGLAGVVNLYPSGCQRPNANTGATITGSALTATSWSITTNTQVTGGTIFLGSAISVSSGASLTFQGTRVYADGFGFSASGASIYMDNTTLVTLAQGWWFQSATTWNLYDTLVIGDTFGGAAGVYYDWGNVTNSIIEEENFNVASSGFFAGTFYNSLFQNITGPFFEGPYNSGDSSFAFDQVTFRNASIYHTGYAGLKVTMNRVFLQNGSFLILSGVSSTVTDSVLNFSVGSTGSNAQGTEVGFDTSYVNITHSTLSYWQGRGSNPVTLYYDSLEPVRLDASGIANLSYDRFAFNGTGEMNTTLWGNDMSIYDGTFNNTYAFYTLEDQGANPHSQITSKTEISALNWLNITYTYLAENEVGYVGILRNCTISHDIVAPWVAGSPNQFQGFAYSGLPVYPGEKEFFNNDTMDNYLYNYTVSEEITAWVGDFAHEGYGNQIEYGNGVPPAYNGTVVISHMTWIGAPIGPTGSYALGFGEGSPKSPFLYTLSDTVFENEPPLKSGGTYGPSFRAEQPFWDLGLGAGVDTVAGNYFLNLNNMTIPFLSEDAGNGKQGWNPVVHLGENHFYYADTSLGGINGNPNQAWSSVMYNTSAPIGSISGYHLITSLLNEYPVMENATVSSASGPLVENTTRTQTAWPPGFFNTTMYSYVIAPDVAIGSGSPVVSYQNGLVAGGQPNFLWSGFNYSEKVEPLSVQLGVNSTRAPPITVAFGGLSAGEPYTIAEYNSSSGVEINGPQNNYVYPSSDGWINVTYNPATMPTDPTDFVLDAANSIGAIAGGSGSFVLILATAGGVIMLGTAFGAYLVATNRREDGP